MKRLMLGLLLAFLTSCQSKSGTQLPVRPEEKKAFPMISVPVTIEEPAARADYLAEHYWDRFDFTDTSYIHLPEITEQALANYIDLFHYTSPGVAPGRLLKAMMAKAEAAPAVFAYFYDLYEKYLYDPNSPLRDEELYIPVLEAVVSSPALAPEYKIRPEHQLKMASKNRTGRKAGDLVYTLASGATGRLHQIEAPYILLFFYNPDCPDCREVKKELRESPVIGRLLRDKQLQILAFYPDEDLEAWKSHTGEIPAGWINGYDRDQTLREKQTYDLKAIPTLYLLDADKTVVLKDTTFPQLELYLETNVPEKEPRRSR